MTTTTTHNCTDCGDPIPAGTEILLGHESELRAFHQGCFESPSQPVVPAQRTA